MNDRTETELQAAITEPRFNKRWLLIGALALLAIAVVLVFALRVPQAGRAGREVPSVESVSGQGAGRAVPTVEEVTSPATPSANAGGKPDLTISPELAGRIQLKIEEARTVPVAAQLRTTGTVQPNAYRETRVTPLVGGRVTTVRAQLGEAVTKGQPLAIIFSQELAEVQMKYLSVHANYEFHHAQARRFDKLYEIGAISKQEMEEVSARLQEHHAEYASLRQKLKLLGLTEPQIDALKDASQVSSEVIVPSPASGIITARSVNPGQVVSMADTLFAVTDLSNVWVIASVYEKDFSLMRQGARVMITAPPFPGRTFSGTISYIDPRVDPQTRTAQARIEVSNPGQMLRLGMFVDVALNTPGTQQAVVIPRAALQTIGSDQVVFVPLAEPGQFQMRKVQVAEDAGDLVRVTGGLNAGEKVVTEGSFFLRAEMGRSNH
ncbi:MAG: efflux RND transporter periplasmic adaptor subunit [Blastocatellia bacterium]